jgi:hypothetical protein
MSIPSYSTLEDGGDRAVHEAMLRAKERILNLPVSKIDRANEIAHEELSESGYGFDTAVREAYISTLESRIDKEMDVTLKSRVDKGIDVNRLNLSIYSPSVRSQHR